LTGFGLVIIMIGATVVSYKVGGAAGALFLLSADWWPPSAN